jgi:hypothetical protein
MCPRRIDEGLWACMHALLLCCWYRYLSPSRRMQTHTSVCAGNDCVCALCSYTTRARPTLCRQPTSAQEHP